MGVTGTYEPPVGQDDAIIEDIAEVKTVVDTINTNTASSGGGLKSVTKTYTTYDTRINCGLSTAQKAGLYAVSVGGGDIVHVGSMSSVNSLTNDLHFYTSYSNSYAWQVLVSTGAKSNKITYYYFG